MSVRGYLTSGLRSIGDIATVIAGFLDPATSPEATTAYLQALSNKIGLTLRGNNDAVQRAILSILDGPFGAAIMKVWNAGGLVVNDWITAGYDSATQPTYKVGNGLSIYGFRAVNNMFEYAFPGQVGNLMYWEDAVHERYDGDRAISLGSFSGWDGVFGTMTKVANAVPGQNLVDGLVELDHFQTATGYRGGIRFAVASTSSPQFAQVGGAFSTPVPSNTELTLGLNLKKISGTTTSCFVYANYFNGNTFVSSATAGAAVPFSGGYVKPVVNLTTPVSGTDHVQILCGVNGASLGDVVELNGSFVKLGTDDTYCPPFVANLDGLGNLTGGAQPGDRFYPISATLPSMRCTTGGPPYTARWTADKLI